MASNKREHVHMRFIKTFVVLSGIWPLDLKGIKKHLYDLYFRATFLFYVLNVCTVYVTAKEVAFRGKTTEITDYVANTIFATLLILKALTYRSKGIKNLLDSILELEKEVLEKYDDESRSIYMENVKSAEYLGSVYIFQGCFMSLCAQVFPLIMTLMSVPDEQGRVEKYYIVPNWEPFDKYEHYYAAFALQFVYTIIAETYIVFCGTFFLFVLKNVQGQLRVLQHRFREGHSVKDCIRFHQAIIQLFNDFNSTFYMFIFMEYIFTSFGLSIVVLEFMLEETIQMKIAAAGFFSAFAGQLLFIYYNADQVTWESSDGLVRAIFDGSWYEIDPKAQKLLVFVIKRAQKPLTLSIGPFRKVGVDSMIALFKATYSYISLMWR
ncbi:unnamed protein product [Phyllotreta striolata]|uniref:Odorant receptor n=1 Tax=Phyllotreta striolata TaxID=444603 RepID=A0A9N9XR17_PHYSR|nr:unnamed protein product [Phyllotreta striolata]